MLVVMAIYLFLLGVSLGSFTLLMVDRMRLGLDWVKGRSECEQCKKKLNVRDLIPIASWLSSSGRCRYCGTKLSVWYPIAELTLGVVYVMSYLYWPYQVSSAVEILRLVIWLFALILLMALVIFDIKWFLLPNKLVYPLILVSILWASTLITVLDVSTVVNYGLSVFVASGIFLILFALSKGKWIGDGDIRLGVAIGLFTGSALQSWLVIFIASIIGLLVGLPAVLLNRKRKSLMKAQVPFGPMLILALCIVVLFGQSMVDWYTSEILLL